MDPGSYCRAVESYLCRKNDGHLIRLVGPSFDLVCGWATQRIPLSVVSRAIDQTFERYYAKGARRRPVRIEFCEADVLELFDDWRRAVGVTGADRVDATVDGSPSGRRPSLAAHMERVIIGLTAWLGGGDRPAALGAVAGRIVDELDAARATAKTARGGARHQLMTRLVDVDRELTAVVRETADDGLRVTLRAEAEHDLEPFRGRMPAAAFRQAVEASTDQLLRHHFKLPRVTFE